MWKVRIPLALALALLTFSASAANRGLSDAIRRARNKGIRINLLELQLKKPALDISDFFGRKSQPTASSASPGSSDPLAQVQIHIDEVTARVKKLFDLQKVSLYQWETTPQDRVNRHYSEIIDTLGLLCCARTPYNSDPAVIRKMMIQNGIEPTAPHPIPAAPL